VYVPAVVANSQIYKKLLLAFATAVETTTTTPFFLTLKLETNNLTKVFYLVVVATTKEVPATAKGEGTKKLGLHLLNLIALNNPIHLLKYKPFFPFIIES
jgi:hypothetical protein